MKIRFLILFILFSLNSIAQPFLGTWTSYLPYNKGSQVVIAENKIYCSTNGGLFYFNKSDNSLNKFSKENGLSDSDISALAYSEYNSCLLIAYKNSNIDLIKDNEIINIPDIMRKQILGDKNIYSVYFDKQFAYLSCGFGIVVLDTDNQEIKESYSIGGDGNPLKVNSLTISDSVIYAGTDEGLYFADLNNPNLIDFNNWSKDTRFSTGSNQIKSLGSFNSKVYISVRFQNLTGDSLLVQKDGQWERYPFFQNPNIRFLKANENGLLICSQTNLDIFDVNGNRISQVYVGEPRMADIDSEGLVWIADFFTGLIRFTIGEGKEVLIPEGPSGIEVFDLYYDQGKLRAVAGGATSSWANVYRWATIYSFSDNQWANWQEDSIRDLIKIISDPDDPDHYFAASWGYGLLEFQDEELINLYRENNSSLQSIIAGGDFFRLGGMEPGTSGLQIQELVHPCLF